MSRPLLVREQRGPIAVITMNRPEQRNALSRALMAQLRDTIDELSVDEKIRAVVLTGARPAFCAGLDLKEAAAIDAAADAEEQTVAALQEFADLLQRLHGLPKPTIAAVAGDALAGGAGLMAACDAVIATDITRIGYPEITRGLVAAVVMHDLCRQIGDRRARELLLGGGLISGMTAQAWGLVNVVVPVDRCLAEACRIAESFAASSAPSAVATTKKMLDEVNARPPDLRGAAAVSASVRCSEEAREGIRAFIEKRPPAWAWVKPKE